jgi:hypothetical protein
MANILKWLFVNTQTASDTEGKSCAEGVRKHCAGDNIWRERGRTSP